METFQVYPSEYPFKYTSNSVPNTDTTPIKSIDDDEMKQLVKLFHSENDYGILNVDLQMLQT